MEYSKKALSVGASPTLAIDARAKKMKADGLDVVGFGAGEPDFNTPEHIREAAKKAIDEGFTKYTASSGMPELRSVICTKFKEDNGLSYTPDQIVVSNGAKHSLMNAFTALLNDGDEVIIPGPYWVSYPEMVKIVGGVPVFVETTEESKFKVTAAQIEKAVTPRTKILIINSPSNPTGMIYSRKELEEIAEVALKYRLYVISDEIYEELVYDGNMHVSIASLGEEIKKNTIVINGLSKSFAMTGWRMGYSASTTEIAEIMGNVQSHSTSNPNSIAQKASIAALTGGKDCLIPMKQEFVRRRDFLVEAVNDIEGLSCLSPEGAFYVMMNISKLFGKTCNGKVLANSVAFSDMLLENSKVAVVAGRSFGADDFVRLSYATSLAAIEKGIARIKDFVETLK